MSDSFHILLYKNKILLVRYMVAHKQTYIFNKSEKTADLLICGTVFINACVLSEGEGQ